MYVKSIDYLCLKESTINNQQKSQQTSKQSEKSPPTNLSREFKLLSYTYCLADAFRRARYNGSDEQCTLIRSRYSEFIDCSVYDERFETKVLEDACKSDQLEIVEKVGNGQLSGHITDKVLQLAIQSGSLSTVKYIVETQPHDLFDIGRAMNLAVTTNRTKIFVCISGSKIPKVSEYYLFDQTMINKAIENGNLMVVRNIFDQVDRSHLSLKSALDKAATIGDLSILDYFIKEKQLEITQSTLDSAASCSNIEIFKYIQNYLPKGVSVTVQTVANTADAGVDSIKYLYDNGLFKYSNQIASKALKKKDNNIMEFLLNNIQEVYNQLVFQMAVQHGNLPVAIKILSQLPGQDVPDRLETHYSTQLTINIMMWSNIS
ncbi:hypothetical protein PPL_02480 [Heterostelium album PN500]|uniref:Ankyrin repeat-containing protein n=1 Tax=Heterostelium pallidum (strain ATCC 26659 / Pp 5 / PN500) TaxID=670386 RepID=D3B273_HETP5|nr:hypothetical protein PPL_02480 [Heterostelium album PN500]EFA84448.1 hypothetical protein PPL_02480 [Heterostelium album PN500]|eukprot:XP_020436562.1 hypothetical protein PPL_02480 [Heterostelium album PN500]